MDDFEERVRERAYHLWIEEGSPAGRHTEHWDRARKLVEEEMQEQASRKAVPASEGESIPGGAVGLGTAPVTPASRKSAAPAASGGPAAERPAAARSRPAGTKRSPPKKPRS